MSRSLCFLPVLGALLLTSGCAGRCREPLPRRAAPFRVIAYVPDYSIDRVPPSAYTRVTDIVLFSAVLNSDGSFPHDTVAALPLARIEEIKRAHGVRTHLCFGGWGRSEGFAEMTSDASKRGAFITALTRFCLDHEFDGVDYDWEFPANPDEHAAYGMLLVETAAAFRPHGLEVSIALGSDQALAPAAFEAVDRIHLMTYDMGLRHSTYDATVASVERLVRSGVSREKICLGVPFYGRRLDNRDVAMAFAEILDTHAPTPDQDEAGGFYFNNAATIRRKVRYALDERLAGVMVWEASMDVENEASLFHAIQDEISRRGE